jgi:hypothetical protein
VAKWKIKLSLPRSILGSSSSLLDAAWALTFSVAKNLFVGGGRSDTLSGQTAILPDLKRSYSLNQIRLWTHPDNSILAKFVKDSYLVRRLACLLGLHILH